MIDGAENPFDSVMADTVVQGRRQKSEDQCAAVNRNAGNRQCAIRESEIDEGDQTANRQRGGKRLDDAAGDIFRRRIEKLAVLVVGHVTPS